MDRLTSFLTSMIVLSLGVERIVEILKGIFAKLNNQKRIVLQLLSITVGSGVAAIVDPHHLLDLAPVSPSPLQLVGWSLLLGLLGSAGSGLWNHLLDIVRAIKAVQERKAPPSPDSLALAPPVDATAT